MGPLVERHSSKGAQTVTPPAAPLRLVRQGAPHRRTRGPATYPQNHLHTCILCCVYGACDNQPTCSAFASTPPGSSATSSLAPLAVATAWEASDCAAEREMWGVKCCGWTEAAREE